MSRGELTLNSSKIKQKALSLGFELVGIAPANPSPDFDFFRWWLDQGYAGTMSYLQRGAERRGNPEKILPGVQSIICCGLNYNTNQKKSTERSKDEAWISSYAWGEDYHEIIGGKLKELAKFIGEGNCKAYTDTGAILERSYAAQAGLGWIGKNSCLINNGLGSFFFLGEVLTTLKLEYDQPTFDQCGSCTKCLDACPTDALVKPGVLDSRKCLSYLTIEYRGEIDPALANKFDGHVAGCDICQEVCPFNETIPASQEKSFYPRKGLVAPKKEALNGSKSPVPRIKQKQWERNLALLDKGGGTVPYLDR